MKCMSWKLQNACNTVDVEQIKLVMGQSDLVIGASNSHQVTRPKYKGRLFQRKTTTTKPTCDKDRYKQLIYYKELLVRSQLRANMASY